METPRNGNSLDYLIDDSGENDILANLAWGVSAYRLFAE